MMDAGITFRRRGKVTIRDVARHAGVSVATVSAVINRNKPVSAPLRERVERAVAELHYRPNLAARALHMPRARTLAFLLPSVSNPFFSDMVMAVEAAAHEHGYGVFVGTSGGDPAKVAFYRDRIPAMAIDGVLVAMSWDMLSGDLIPALRAHGVSVVGIGGSRSMPDIDCFSGDDVDAGRKVGRYLLALGHRRIAFLGPADSEAAALRRQGLAESLQEQGAEPDDALWMQVRGHGERQGYRGTEELLARNVHFSALVGFNDLAALGALSALEDQGFRVPERISVVGFGDTVSAFSRPKITTVAYPKEAMVRSALNRLLQRIEGSDDAPELRRFPVELRIRQSTRAAATA